MKQVIDIFDDFSQRLDDWLTRHETPEAPYIVKSLEAPNTMNPEQAVAAEALLRRAISRNEEYKAAVKSSIG